MGKNTINFPHMFFPISSIGLFFAMGEYPMIDELGLSVEMYSHLSSKHEVKLTKFEKKIPHPRTFPPSIDLDFLHTPLLVYCSYVQELL